MIDLQHGKIPSIRMNYSHGEIQSSKGRQTNDRTSRSIKSIPWSNNDGISPSKKSIPWIFNDGISPSKKSIPWSYVHSYSSYRY